MSSEPDGDGELVIWSNAELCVVAKWITQCAVQGFVAMVRIRRGEWLIFIECVCVSVGMVM